MNRAIKILLVFIFFSCHLDVFAGDQGGPYVIWVNLSNNKKIDKMIEENIQKQDDCLPAQFDMKSPSWVTSNLVKKAVINEDRSAIKTLDKLLHRPFNDTYIDKGFDGVIVYDEISGPRFSNLITGQKSVIKVKVADVKEENASWKTFCRLIPPITRPL